MTTVLQGVYMKPDPIILDDEIHVIDWPHEGMGRMAELHHVHALDGRCVKRRMGERCAPPPPERSPHEGDLLSFLMSFGLLLALAVGGIVYALSV